jgi:hypothetical protein
LVRVTDALGNVVILRFFEKWVERTGKKCTAHRLIGRLSINRMGNHIPPSSKDAEGGQERRGAADPKP